MTRIGRLASRSTLLDQDRQERSDRVPFERDRKPSRSNPRRATGFDRYAGEPVPDAVLWRLVPDDHSLWDLENCLLTTLFEQLTAKLSFAASWIDNRPEAIFTRLASELP